jgi:Domain of unknown function (DUF1707)
MEQCSPSQPPPAQPPAGPAQPPAGTAQPPAGTPQPPAGPAQTPGAAADTASAAPAPAVRLSDRDRDEVAHRLQEAFAEGRLDDDEFDQRMRAALTAKLSTELEAITADLPAGTQRPAAVAPAVVAGRTPGKFAIAYKSGIRRGGRWRVPERFSTIVYKGNGRLDLRAAELSAPVTTLLTIAYKSHVDVLVPPGVRVELDGFGVSKGWSAEEELERLLPADAPVIHVRGIGYKGTIEVSTKPGDSPGPGQPALPR